MQIYAENADNQQTKTRTLKKVAVTRKADMIDEHGHLLGQALSYVLLGVSQYCRRLGQQYHRSK